MEFKSQVELRQAPGILSIAAGLSAWLLINVLLPGNFPGLEWDEAVYACVIQSVKDTGIVTHVADVSRRGEFYGWHPPFYFWIAGLAANLFPSASALDIGRAVNLAGMFLTFGIVSVAITGVGRMPPRFAVVALLLGMCDLWVFMSARTGWFENLQFVLVAASQICFAWVLKEGSARAVLTAGLVAGAAVVFKHIGAWLFVEAGILFLLFSSRRRQMVLLCLTMFAVILCYICMQWLRGGEDFLAQQLHHVFRALGRTPSPSVNFSVGQALALFVAAYGIFWPSLLVTAVGMCAASTVLVMIGYVNLWQRREAAMLARPDVIMVAVLAAWLFASFFGLAVIKLRNPHYYFIVFLPAAIFSGLVLAALLNRKNWRQLAVFCVAILMAGNVFGLVSRSGWNDGAFDRYMSHYGGRFNDGVILTEEPLACLSGGIIGFRDIRLEANRDPNLLGGSQLSGVILLSSRAYKPDVSKAWEEALRKNYRLEYRDSDWKWQIEVWVPLLVSRAQ